VGNPHSYAGEGVKAIHLLLLFSYATSFFFVLLSTVFVLPSSYATSFFFCSKKPKVTEGKKRKKEVA